MEFYLEKDEGTCTVHLLSNLTEDVTQVFASLRTHLAGRRTLVFDCGSVRRVHFLGMLKWIKELEQLGSEMRYTFTRCPPEFVNAALMVPRFCGNGLVESIYVEHVCSDCGETRQQLYRVSRRAAGLVQQPTSCRACGGTALPDGDAAKDLEMLVAQNLGEGLLPDEMAAQAA